jgi:large subunit ribosomal protein L10
LKKGGETLKKENKAQVVADLAVKLAKSKSTFLADYRGLTVEQVNTLRGALRNSGAEYKVAKNTLLRLATKGTASECLNPLLAGPTAIAIASGDPVATAKVMADFAKSNAKFELKGGALDGKVLSVSDIKALAELPSREVLLARMLGSFSAPATNFVGVLAAVPRAFVQVLAAYKDQKAA